MATFKQNLPFAAADKFDIIPAVVADESDYSGVVGGGTGRCVAFASVTKGRALKMSVAVGTLSGSPSGLTFGLGVSSDANGTSLAFVSGTTTEVASPTAGKLYTAEIPMSYVSDSSKFYSACVALKGGGTTTAIVATVTEVLDPVFSGT